MLDDGIPENLMKMIMRATMADEAIASAQLAGAELTPRERRRIKCELMFPDMKPKDIELYLDVCEKMEKEKPKSEKRSKTVKKRRSSSVRA